MLSLLRLLKLKKGGIKPMQKIKRIVGICFFIGLAVLMSCTMVKIIAYPELYITSWRYQLQNEVRAGKPEAVEYYERQYIAKGIELF